MCTAWVEVVGACSSVLRSFREKVGRRGAARIGPEQYSGCLRGMGGMGIELCKARSPTKCKMRVAAVLAHARFSHEGGSGTLGSQVLVEFPRLWTSSGRKSRLESTCKIMHLQRPLLVELVGLMATIHETSKNPARPFLLSRASRVH